MRGATAMTRIYFIRHGQSKANLRSCFAGHYDAPLTELGHIQAMRTAESVKNVNFTAVYASDLARAAATGQAVADLHGLPLQATARLREINAGEWETLPFNELSKRDDYGVWMRQIGVAVCPGGESVAQLQQRVRAVVKDIVLAHPGETVCVATHATPIRVMECVWTNTPLEEMHTIPWVSNASVTIAEYDDAGRGRLIERDLHDHLLDLATGMPANV